jgi:hypothetical protein
MKSGHLLLAVPGVIGAITVDITDAGMVIAKDFHLVKLLTQNLQTQ